MTAFFLLFPFCICISFLPQRKLWFPTTSICQYLLIRGYSTHSANFRIATPIPVPTINSLGSRPLHSSFVLRIYFIEEVKSCTTFKSYLLSSVSLCCLFDIQLGLFVSVWIKFSLFHPFLFKFNLLMCKTLTWFKSQNCIKRYIQYLQALKTPLVIFNFKL